MKIAFVILASLVVASCDAPVTSEPRAESKLDEGEVTLMAIAPDGTKLWGVRSYGRTIYFASTGTSVSENCGKGCTYERATPTVH